MLIGHEHFYPDFRKGILEVAALPMVLDLGTTQRFRKELQPFESAFRGNYLALDYRAQCAFGDRNVDVDGDIQALPFSRDSVDGALCIEVLEHIPNPQLAIDEIHRVLRKGGLLLLTTPFLQAYHGKPGDYSDYYRFTDEGLRWLLRRFGETRIVGRGGLPYRLLMTLLPVSLGQVVLRSRTAMAMVNALDRRIPTRSPLGWIVCARK